MTSSVFGAMSPSFTLVLFLNVILASLPLRAVAAEEYHKQPSDSKAPTKRSVLDAAESPRLLELIKMRDVVSKMLPEHVSDRDGAVDIGEEGGSESTPLSKRVFCNGFTGCGGRFRGRRRQLSDALGKRRLAQRRIAKRPFCNQLGCYNGGGKRERETMDPTDQQQLNDFLSASAYGLPIVAPLSSAALDEKVKKLFCNGYGGCQNGGKRLVSSRGDVELPLLEESLQKFPKVKRFFAGGYDNDMESLIDSLKR